MPRCACSRRNCSSPKFAARPIIEIGSSGTIFDRRQTIQGLRQEEAGAPISLRDFAARRLSPDVVLVTYRTVREGRPGSRLRSSIWQWIDGRWQMVFHQRTPSAMRG